MIQHIRRGVLTVAAALSVAVFGIASVGVGAQTAASNKAANGFRISPVRSEISIEKGKTQTVTVTVENPTDIPTTAQAVVNDFVASEDETGTPRLILDTNVAAPKNSFKKLVSTIDTVQLGARQKKDVPVRISVPANANAGGYYGAIRFVASADGQQSNVGLTASVGTIVLVTVPGNLTEKIDLLELTAAQNEKPKSFFTGGEVAVIARLKNSGDIHVKPFGRVEVKSMFGKTVATYEFNNTEPRANILPESTRKFINDLPKDTKWFGRYTITTNLAYSQGGGDLITAKSTFWYIPTAALYAIVATVLVLALLIIIGVRKLTKRHTSR